MVIAKYEMNWQYLSDKHEEIDRKLLKLLDDYANDRSEHLSFAIIGTFGSGKTQLLYFIHKCAKEKGM